MNISYRWLQEYVNCGNTSAATLADMLTMAGLEGEGLEERKISFPENVVGGEIVDVQTHPTLSNLYVCQVDVGKSERIQIVCGAPNTLAHKKSPVALPGAILPNGMTVQIAEIHGIRSEGVLCAEDELGISSDHSGIIFLLDDALPGKPLSAEMLSIEDDVILKVGLTPNRGDCLSHIGIAREAATLLKLPLKKPAIDYIESANPIAHLASVTIRNPELCHRYAASVIIDIKIAPSPLWLRRRLESVGVRSINNVVDVTNFVMMELGQPLHAFDLDQIAGQKIIVRRAADGEAFTTLDGVERRLDANALLIADEKRAVGIAGVMGGLNSEISPMTARILLESACFAPLNIRKTAKKLGLNTEASYRFERGVDLLGVDYALRRATKLIAELAQGKAAQNIIDVFPHSYVPAKIVLRISQVQKILGMEVSFQNIRTILSLLGFDILQESQGKLEVAVPSYRPDVSREIDLIEEIGRIYGYDNIPAAYPSGMIPPKMENPVRDIEQIIRTLCLAQGMDEVINYSFFDTRNLDALQVAQKEPYNKTVALRNPLNAEQSVLRTTTIPGLLRNVVLNASHRRDHIRLFEIGKIFIRKNSAEELPEEKTMLSGILSGCRTEIGWTHSQERVDFYDVKGIIENILHKLSVSYEFRNAEHIEFLHPGEMATIHANGEAIGYIGRLHPDVAEMFDIRDNRAYVFELSLEAIVAHTSLSRTFSLLPKFPSVYRDLAVVVPASSIQASKIEAIITETGQPLLKRVVLFDRYVGPQIEKGCVGLTYSLWYRSSERTLIDSEVAEIHQRIIDRLHIQLGIALR